MNGLTIDSFAFVIFIFIYPFIYLCIKHIYLFTYLLNCLYLCFFNFYYNSSIFTFSPASFVYLLLLIIFFFFYSLLIVCISLLILYSSISPFFFNTIKPGSQTYSDHLSAKTTFSVSLRRSLIDMFN